MPISSPQLPPVTSAAPSVPTTLTGELAQKGVCGAHGMQGALPLL